MRVLVALGRDHAPRIPAEIQPEWEGALRFGLEIVGAPNPADVDIRFASYSDIMGPDRAMLDAPPSELQAAVANELLPVHPDEERPEWDRVAAIVQGLNDAFDVGEAVLTSFLGELDQYFGQAGV